MYIKFADYNNATILNSGDSVLMSLDEFENGGKNLIDVPVTITKDGNEPKEVEEVLD